MITHFKISNGKRRSLLTGISFILFILCLELITDCFNYRQFSSVRKNVSISSHSPLTKDSEEQTLNEIEESLTVVKIRMGTHLGLILALGCLYDAATITVLSPSNDVTG